MFALPPHLGPDTDAATGLACPDCNGVLAVRSEGHAGHLNFQCRIGHAFSLRDLLAAKEDVIESRLWTAVVAFEELIALLADLERRAEPGSREPAPYAARIRQAEAHVKLLRQVLEANAPLDLGHIDSSGRKTETGEPA